MHRSAHSRYNCGAKGEAALERSANHEVFNRYYRRDRRRVALDECEDSRVEISFFFPPRFSQRRDLFINYLYRSRFRERFINAETHDAHESLIDFAISFENCGLKLYIELYTTPALRY